MVATVSEDDVIVSFDALVISGVATEIVVIVVVVVVVTVVVGSSECSGSPAPQADRKTTTDNKISSYRISPLLLTKKPLHGEAAFSYKLIILPYLRYI